MWYFNHGTVGSGKSLNLLSKYLDKKRKYPEQTVLIKPQMDSRTSGVYTRFGPMEVSADLSAGPHNRLEWLWLLEKKKYFFIDELQFYAPKVLYDINNYNTRYNKTKFFYTYGLRNDFLKNMWATIAYTLNKCDEIKEIKSECEICKASKAVFNKKTAGDFTRNELGFNYIGVCGECYAS